VLKQFKLQISIWGLLLKQQFTEVVTQSKVADAETQSCYIVQGRRCWNTKLLHSPRSQMLKHKAITQSKVVDAETQKIDDAEEAVTQFMAMILKHKGSSYTVSGQQELYNSCTVSQAPTIAPTWECWNNQERKSHG